jgi:hypothetical protein
MAENEKHDEKMTPFEAALAGLQPRPDRLDPRWRALLAEEVSQKEKTTAGRPQPLEMAPCSAASDHVFACVYCGVRGPGVSTARRWAWPMAFSAMTVLAASLLLVLVARSGPIVALHDSQGRGPEMGISAAEFPSPPISPRLDRLCYLGIRRQVLLHGVESWPLPASTQPLPARAKEPPLFYRDQLNRFLNQPGSAG